MLSTIQRGHLEIIRAIDRGGSVTAAAESLYVTQPALSHSIRKLEESLGLKIWDREGRVLRLTQGGQYLLEVANRLLPQFERAEQQLRQFAQGERGTLRVGMECHPCYQWLLKIAEPFLEAWPDVDLDVIQKFQFGGIDALTGHDIDVLVTPDPLKRQGLFFEPVFDYEQVLVVGPGHPLRKAKYAEAEQLADQTLITYPVSVDRLDVFNYFLAPAGVVPARHKLIETTDIILQMVACGRGVAALPRWLVKEQQARFEIFPVRLGKTGIDKQIFLGLRKNDLEIDYVKALLEVARASKSLAK
ncbi:HTH-type transcriptional regulator CynR [Caulifigura coniformis]|uniref:HTH-type transcriptional regulator MetR n=1 Tax=Caulifigura coniformis TaxID=2527983 RepID=A0A517SI26_9PLAN|nr:LysR family transcriptional regulator [Caulifigura coniformis]QDT55781.1 HTH-type transcriptional regulator CynR [Caulifigura coniformis]